MSRLKLILAWIIVVLIISALIGVFSYAVYQLATKAVVMDFVIAISGILIMLTGIITVKWALKTVGWGEQ